ncbi:MAG: hypothetical protein PHV21_03405 [Synergistaceae bacterium]|nr:hypothetical protein [Synergistaceae bacterium]
MRISYKLTGEARKNLVKAIAKELETDTHYCGAPTFNYTVGEFTIDKTGTVTGPDDRGLIADLEGFYDLKPVEAEYDTQRTAAAIESTEAQSEEVETQPAAVTQWTEETSSAESEVKTDTTEAEEAYGLTVSLPREGYSAEVLENLKRLINSKASLIKKALGLTDLPIEIDDKVISFPWYAGTPSPEVINATSHLIGMLAAFAKAHRISNKADEPVENEKFAFRCFLIRLGFVGKEYKEIRRTLLKNMTGNGAFKSGRRPIRQTEVRTEIEKEAAEEDERNDR